MQLCRTATCHEGLLDFLDNFFHAMLSIVYPQSLLSWNLGIHSWIYPLYEAAVHQRLYAMPATSFNVLLMSIFITQQVANMIIRSANQTMIVHYHVTVCGGKKVCGIDYWCAVNPYHILSKQVCSHLKSDKMKYTQSRKLNTDEFWVCCGWSIQELHLITVDNLQTFEGRLLIILIESSPIVHCYFIMAMCVNWLQLQHMWSWQRTMLFPELKSVIQQKSGFQMVDLPRFCSRGNH